MLTLIVTLFGVDILLGGALMIIIIGVLVKLARWIFHRKDGY